jgi:predicted  nucleic acid-binding Zn-ribbon protein
MHRRTLNEHYASALAWESRRLQHLASHLPDANSSTPTNRSSSPKGKERETSHTLEFERLQNRVAELEDLIDDGGTREADLAGEVKRLTKELERERVQAEKDRSHLEAQIHEVRNTTTGRPELRSTDNDDTIRAILLPLLAFATKPPPPDDVPIDSLAQLVREEYEILEGLLSVGKEELTSVKERLEGEASALRKGTDVLREETQRLTKENQSLREETQKL